MGLDSCAAVLCCHAGQEIAHQGGPTEGWHRVLWGAVRQYAVRPDGRRQIVDLLLPGDWLGFAAPDGDRYAAEAIIEGTLLASYPRGRVQTLADTHPDVQRLMVEAVFETVSRLQKQLLMLGRVTAVEKVGSFLIEISERLPNEHPDRLELPLSRYDIADYLAISVETVSRALTDLKQRGVISLAGARQVRIVNREALDEGRNAELPFGSVPAERLPRFHPTMDMKSKDGAFGRPSRSVS
jgi:CRP/FNR family nitrogen fixation transcriptional regulator